MNYLGIDWGEKRIGLATADSGAKLAVPYGVVSGLPDVLRVAREEDIDMIIVGEPKSLSGAGSLSPAFELFVAGLRKKAKAEVKLSDERLSSKAADSLAGLKKEKAARDAVAAMIILQSYLERNG